ncbi:hypothetical protein BN439_1732 [Erwinia amylovora Ea644]|nr:hypothetical protein BN439_1732 [Erwinia amylovora Ea644]
MPGRLSTNRYNLIPDATGMALRHSPVGQEYHWPLARQSVFVASRISAIAWSLILAFFYSSTYLR